MNKREIRKLDTRGLIIGLEKEIAFRERKFPELVKDGKMDEQFAAYQIDLFKQILAGLNRLKELE